MFMCMLLLPLKLHHAEQNNVLTSLLVNAIIKLESNYKHKAVSSKRAIGLMQVRYSVWKDILKKEGLIKNKKDLFHPEKNIKAGTFILKYYLKKHDGNLEKALKSYSGGAKNYYSKVIKNMKEEENELKRVEQIEKNNN